MKKYFIYIMLLFLTLMLSSCFGGDGGVDETGLIEREQENFTIKLPLTWNTVDADDLPLPKNGDIELAYASPEERQGYINNIIIISDENHQNESSVGLMKNSANFLKGGLSGFTLIEQKDVAFQDDEVGTILSFRGRYNPNTPELSYIQTARSCGETSYFLTISLAEQLESYERYEYLLESFECK